MKIELVRIRGKKARAMMWNEFKTGPSPSAPRVFRPKVPRTRRFSFNSIS